MSVDRIGDWFCWPEGPSYIKVDSTHSGVLKWLDDDNPLMSDELEGRLYDVILPLVVRNAPRTKVLGWNVYPLPSSLCVELDALPIEPYVGRNDE